MICSRISKGCTSGYHKSNVILGHQGPHNSFCDLLPQKISLTLGVGSLKRPFNFWVVQDGKSTWGLIRVCSLCRKRDDEQKWQWMQAGWEDWSGWQEAGWEDWSGWQDWSHHHDDDDDHDAGDPEPTPKSKKETLDKKWLDLSCPILTS